MIVSKSKRYAGYTAYGGMYLKALAAGEDENAGRFWKGV